MCIRVRLNADSTERVIPSTVCGSINAADRPSDSTCAMTDSSDSDAKKGLEVRVKQKLEDIDLDETKRLETIPIGKADDGREFVVRIGQYGPYLQVVGEEGATASVPEDMAPDELTIEKVIELFEAPSGDRELGTDPETDKKVLPRSGPFVLYVPPGEGGNANAHPQSATDVPLS